MTVTRLVLTGSFVFLMACSSSKYGPLTATVEDTTDASADGDDDDERRKANDEQLMTAKKKIDEGR